MGILYTHRVVDFSVCYAQTEISDELFTGYGGSHHTSPPPRCANCGVLISATQEKSQYGYCVECTDLMAQDEKLSKEILASMR